MKYTQDKIKELIKDKKYDLVVKSMEGLIKSICNNYQFKSNLDWDELVSLANLGLANAINKFDVYDDRNASFATYAKIAINNEIINGIKNTSRTIRLPQANQTGDDKPSTISLRDDIDVIDTNTYQSNLTNLLEDILENRYECSLIKLKYVEGKTNEEIGKIHNKSGEAIRKNIIKIINKLKNNKEFIENLEL